jgi:hypothetical protein
MAKDKEELKDAQDNLDPRPDSKKDADDEDIEDEEKDLDLEDRKKNYAGLEKVKEQMEEIYEAVLRGFEDKSDQNATCDRAWDMYNCVLNENQGYEGNSHIYVPLVRDAIEARVTRFSNQMFPQNGRYADVVGAGEIPWDIIALLDYYVGATKLRSVVMPALLREGDCSGQYSLYLDWVEDKRHTVKKTKKPETVSALGNAPMDGDTYDDREYQEIKDARPDVMVLDTRNLVVLPASVDEIDDAEVVGVALRLTKARVKKYMRDGVFDKDAGEDLLANFDQQNSGASQQPDTDKKALNNAGVKTDSKGNKRALVYKVWAKIKIKGEYRLCEMFFAGPDNFLSCKRIPFWSDRVPVISKPAIKVPNSFWGKSPSEAVEKLQYQANDAVNIGMDSAPFSLLPIVMTDPEKNPKIGSMIMAQAAIWETNPNDTKIMEIPPLWQQAMEIVSLCKDQVMQSMSVNSAMMPHAAGGKEKKPSQAQAAQEQQVALESTNNVVNLLEEGILNITLEKFYEMDYQYREEPLTIQKFGQMGLQADLQQIPLIEVGSHYIFRWNGTEANKSTQQVQQMIAAMNVLRGIPPQQMNGMKLDITPVLEQLASAAFGPRLAPKILIDQKHQMLMTPELENELMANAFPVHVNPQDNDIEHIQSHQADLSVHPNNFNHQHIMEHIAQMKAKSMEAQGLGPDGKPQGQPGVPGGAGPGVAGTPRMGAQPGQPRPQQPAGAIHPDQMPLAPPRR